MAAAARPSPGWTSKCSVRQWGRKLQCTGGLGWPLHLSESRGLGTLRGTFARVHPSLVASSVLRCHHLPNLGGSDLAVWHRLNRVLPGSPACVAQHLSGCVAPNFLQQETQKVCVVAITITDVLLIVIVFEEK